MRNTFKRLLAVALLLSMVLTLLPTQSFAAHSHTHEESVSKVTKSITSGTYVLAANVNGTYYAMPSTFSMTSGKVLGEAITLVDGAVSEDDAVKYSVTVASYGSGFAIYNGTSYLKYSSGTNLATSTTAYEWTISAGTNGTYRIASSATTDRGILFRAGAYNRFGAYAVSNTTSNASEYFDVELLRVGDAGDVEDPETPESITSSVSIADGEYVIAAKVGTTYYAMANAFAGKITGAEIAVTNGKVSSADAAGYTVTVSASGNFHTIKSESSYLAYVSSTNLGSSSSAYLWAIIEGTNGTYRAVASTDNTRGLIFQKTTDYTRFGGYAVTNATEGSSTYFDIELLPVEEGGSSAPSTPIIADGNYVIAAYINGTYYAMSNYFEEKIPGTGIIVSNGCVTAENAADYVVTISANGDYYTIKNENGYLKYMGGTNLGYSATDPYDWSITKGTNGTYRITAAATLSASTVRALAYRQETYNNFGAYATSNLANYPDNYYDIELLPIGDPEDYVKKTFALVATSSDYTAGDYIIVSQAINSNDAFYMMTTSQEPGYYYMTSELLPDTELPQTISIDDADYEKLVWTMEGSRTSFTLKNSEGQYLSNSASTARLNLSSTALSWTASAYSTTKLAFHFKANNYYISLRDDTATVGANGYPMFGGTAVVTSPPGHIYMNVYKACAHSSVTTRTLPPTCIESGASNTVCDDCGVTVSWTSYPATGHNIDYAVNTATTHSIICNTCGEEMGVENCVYSNLSCYRCGNPEPENDYSGRYYFAAIRSSASSTYHFMTFDLVGTSTRRYASEDSGMVSLPTVITTPVSNKVYVIEKNEEGTYRIFAEGLAGDNCLAWEVDANASENSGAFADTFNAYELTIGLSGEAGDGNKIVNIYFVENDLPRYLSLNNTLGNNYFAWYTNASSQRKDIVLVPVEGEATCLHTNRTTVVTAPTCLTAGVETIYCSDCGVIVGENELLASGHALQYEWVEDGIHSVKCSNCDYATTEECTLVGDICLYCSGGDLECFQLVTDPADLTTDRYLIIAAATGGSYAGENAFYGVGVQQDSNHNALSSYGMTFDSLPTEIYLEGTNTAQLVWNLTGTKSGFTLTTDSGKSLYHNTGNDLLLGSYTATTWTGDFSTTEGHFAVKHNNAYYLALRTDWNTLDDSDVYSPLVNCVENTDTGNYKMFFFKKYSGCLHQNTNTTIVEPTCTRAGSMTVICLDCNQLISSESLEAYGHDPSAFEATEPTCTVAGNKAYWFCADCDSYFSDELCTSVTSPEAIAIPATGHSWDDGQITVSPTCTEQGTMTYICYICTGTKEEPISALGHFYTRVITPPTCTEQGYTTHTCTGCGDKYISNYTDAFGHNYQYTNNTNGTHNTTCSNCDLNTVEECVYENNICVCGATAQSTACTHASTRTETTTAATCTSTGTYRIVCNSCAQVLVTGTVAALGHEYSYSANNDGTHGVTCTRACGLSLTEECVYENGVCICGATQPDECGHTSVKTEITDATCTTAGSIKVLCADCGELINTAELPATGHSIVEVAAKSATCTESGCNKHWACTNCGGYFADASGKYTVPESFAVIAPLGHSYSYADNGGNHSVTCARGCGYQATESHVFENNVCVCGAIKGTDPLTDSSLTFSMNISVGAEMTVSYNISASAVSKYEDFYLEVKKENAGGEPSIVTYGLTEEHNAMGNIADLFYFATYTGISAKEMGDNFATTLYATASDGTVYRGNTVNESIKAYLISRFELANATDELKTMAIDMLRYGAAAQIRFDYNTGNLVTKDLTAAQLVYATQGIPDAVDKQTVTGSGQNISTNITLSSKVDMKLTCMYTPADPTQAKFVVMDTQEGKILAELPVEMVAGLLCTATYSDVGAKQMRRTIAVCLFDNGLPVSKMLTWSVESFVAQTRANANASQAEIDMVNAMLTYGDSVAAYMTSIGQ